MSMLRTMRRAMYRRNNPGMELSRTWKKNRDERIEEQQTLIKKFLSKIKKFGDTT